MAGKTVRLFTVSVLLMAGGLHASAEVAAPSENITVTAARSREMLGKFAGAFETPTQVTGKIARWERRICPVVVGQDPHFTTFITQRVKYIALAAGARVNTDASCTPNIEIVFTTTPQDLVDNVRQLDPIYLGYAETSSRREILAAVTRPVQAWYTTETVDLRGRRVVDSGLPMGNGTTLSIIGATAGDIMAGGRETLFMPPAYASNGNRIDDGIHTDFNHILIVVDSTKLAGQRIVPLADYISMLALTQLNSLDVCQPLPSIANMLAADCNHATDALTQFDLAYLQGLYRMGISRKLIFQRNDIADAMTENHLIAAAGR